MLHWCYRERPALNNKEEMTMFDTMQIARRIKQARIEKNMTQMDLADAMGVSFQAVSNWERGNSMPDIGKLGDLCAVLGLDVSELLGVESKAAEVVDKALEKEELTLDELAEVAPMLPPQQVREQTEKAKGRKKVNISQIMGLAPFLDEQYLSNLVADADVEDLSEVACLAPFLDRKTLRDLVVRCENNGEFGTIMELAPFLDKQTLDTLVEKLEAEDISQVVSLAPFLSRDTLDRLVEKSVLDADSAMLCGLAPFLSKDTLGKLVDRLLEQDGEPDLSCIDGLAPFLSKETLRKVADRLMEDRDLSGLSSVMPFL